MGGVEVGQHDKGNGGLGHRLFAVFRILKKRKTPFLDELPLRREVQQSIMPATSGGPPHSYRDLPWEAKNRIIDELLRRQTELLQARGLDEEDEVEDDLFEFDKSPWFLEDEQKDVGLGWMSQKSGEELFARMEKQLADLLAQLWQRPNFMSSGGVLGGTLPFLPILVSAGLVCGTTYAVRERGSVARETFRS